MNYKPRLRRISGCRYTPAQRRMFGRKMIQGKAMAESNRTWIEEQGWGAMLASYGIKY